jgi:hypothetical protein
MDPNLHAAIETLHDPAAWVHLATIGHDGGPHVTQMMMGLTAEHLPRNRKSLRGFWCT